MERAPRRAMMMLRFWRPVFHMALIVLSFWVMYEVRQTTDLIPFVQLRIPALNLRETMLFAVCSAGAFVVIGIIRGLYELFRPLHRYYTVFLESWLIWVVVSSAIAYYGFGYVFVSGVSRFVVVWGAVASFVAITLRDRWRNGLNNRLERQKPYRILLLAKTEHIRDYLVPILRDYRIYSVQTHLVGTTAEDEWQNEWSEKNAHLLQYDIILVAGTFGAQTLQYYTDCAKINGQLFYHVSDHHLLEDVIAAPQRLGPLMVMEYRASPLDGRRRVLKRWFDLCASTLALALLSPVFLVIALLIKLDSPGPVFYVQKRVGKNGKLFDFIKFRSMYTHLSTGEKYGGKDAWELKEQLVHSPANVRKGVLPKIQNDPRVTRLGRVLRKTSLDELPNLFSVWRGTMSLVGPRPHEPHEVARYSGRQRRLFSIKPGMTGYAQIFGRDELPFDEEARLDLHYIQHRSLLLDLYVIITTVKVVIKGR